jgi:hypothetical protein
MITIKEGSSSSAIKKTLQRLKTSRGLHAHKYLGVIKLKQSPLNIQKKMRNEWA